MDTTTISWLPTSGRIRVYAPRPEPGRNYGLVETVHNATAVGERVAMWGPYEVPSDFGGRFVARKHDLDSGRFQYRAVDTAVRKTHVTDCIHAVSDIDRAFNRGRYPLNRYGDRATAFIVHNLVTRGGTLGERTHDWLVPALGLERYPVVRKAVPAGPYPLADLTVGFERFARGSSAVRE